jgi:sec-independent protein translocase protein TatA
MGSFSIWHWIIVLGLVLVLFGRGKVSELMGDVAKGIKSFKKGMAEDDEPVARTVEHKHVEPIQPAATPADRVEPARKDGNVG